jgi:hypothetical protein
MYMFGLLEACIARCALAGSFDIDSQAVDESIDELLAVLDTTTYEVVCCRHVSHLTTASGDEVQVGLGFAEDLLRILQVLRSADVRAPSRG